LTKVDAEEYRGRNQNGADQSIRPFLLSGPMRRGTLLPPAYFWIEDPPSSTMVVPL